MPSFLALPDGSRVGGRQAWEAHRASLRTILQRFSVGTLPPAPQAVQITELRRETLREGRLLYRLVRLTFGPAAVGSLEVGLLQPVSNDPVPFVITPSGTPPGGTVLPLLPKGHTQGKGLNVLLPVIPPATAAPSPGKPVQLRTLAERLQEFDVPLSRGYGVAFFNHQDCGEDTTLRSPDGSWAYRHTRFPSLYPECDWGLLGVWAWGMSRVADVLVADPSVRKDALIVTGVSRLGKAALVAAAFDDRLMAAPVVSGGGGLGAWRASGQGRGGREGLAEMMNKYPNWFAPDLRSFWGNVDRLPFDQHWLVALCAPRPFIALEGIDDPVSLPNAVRLTLRSSLPAYALYGATDRVGLHVARHGHTFDEQDWSAMLDFADQKLLGRPSTRELGVESAPAALAYPESSFDVSLYGATGNGLSKDTAAFQRALDTCAVSGGGEVFVPQGRYLIGSIQLGNRTTLRLAPGAVLVGSGDPADYPTIDVRWEGRTQPGRRALIHAENVERIAIVGPGRIRGNAEVAASQNPRGSVVLEAMNCAGVTWDGFTVLQAGNWATHPTHCTDVLIRNLTIRGRRDGIDIDSCSRVRIENCDIDTGDDCISLKSGRGLNGARLMRPTEDVEISGCLLRGTHWACIGIGSETSGGIRRIRIRDTVFADSATHALYIKSRVGRAASIEDIVVEDCEVRAGNFLRFNLSSAGNKNTADDPMPGALGLVSARNFRFTKLRLACKTLVEATQIPDEAPLRHVELRDITGTCTQGMFWRNVRGLHLSNVNLACATGPLLSTESCTGTGLDSAAPLPSNAKK